MVYNVYDVEMASRWMVASALLNAQSGNMPPPTTGRRASVLTVPSNAPLAYLQHYAKVAVRDITWPMVPLAYAGLAIQHVRLVLMLSRLRV